MGRGAGLSILVTGGAGFVGGSVVRQLMAETDEPVTVLDAMRYAATDDVRAAYVQNPRFQFIEADLADAGAARAAVLAAQPRLILNLAAETHVDRSIDDPAVFVDANVVGTTNLLTAARAWLEVGTIDPAHFRFVQISTDEVFGALGSSGLFTEETRLDPSSPYSASKAAPISSRSPGGGLTACPSSSLRDRIRMAPISFQKS